MLTSYVDILCWYPMLISYVDILCWHPMLRSYVDILCWYPMVSTSPRFQEVLRGGWVWCRLEVIVSSFLLHHKLHHKLHHVALSFCWFYDQLMTLLLTYYMIYMITSWRFHMTPDNSMDFSSQGRLDAISMGDLCPLWTSQTDSRSELWKMA